ncbi:hypothetical protein R3P38DRAFT_3290925 [Favolaschia claudopus]|uniref:Uncharacterized protein n=1 Tax=Favolaschia claudopus TaxID=2862362 RepID=A0AAV9ZQQ9_9AGAR
MALRSPPGSIKSRTSASNPPRTRPKISGNEPPAEPPASGPLRNESRISINRETTKPYTVPRTSSLRSTTSTPDPAPATTRVTPITPSKIAKKMLSSSLSVLGFNTSPPKSTTSEPQPDSPRLEGGYSREQTTPTPGSTRTSGHVPAYDPDAAASLYSGDIPMDDNTADERDDNSVANSLKPTEDEAFDIPQQLVWNIKSSLSDAMESHWRPPVAAVGCWRPLIDDVNRCLQTNSSDHQRHSIRQTPVQHNGNWWAPSHEKGLNPAMNPKASNSKHFNHYGWFRSVLVKN